MTKFYTLSFALLALFLIAVPIRADSTDEMDILAAQIVKALHKGHSTQKVQISQKDALAKITKKLAGPKVTITPPAPQPAAKVQAPAQPDEMSKIASEISSLLKDNTKKTQKTASYDDIVAKLLKRYQGAKVKITPAKPVQKVEKVKISQEQALAKIAKRLAGPKVTITKTEKPQGKYDEIVAKLMKKYQGAKVTITPAKTAQKVEKVKISQEQALAKIAKRLAGPKVTITKAATEQHDDITSRMKAKFAKVNKVAAPVTKGTELDIINHQADDRARKYLAIIKETNPALYNKLITKLSAPQPTAVHTRAPRTTLKYEDVVAKFQNKYKGAHVTIIPKAPRTNLKYDEIVAKLMKKYQGAKVTIAPAKTEKKVEKVQITQEEALAKIVKRLAGPKVTITKTVKPVEKVQISQQDALTKILKKLAGPKVTITKAAKPVEKIRISQEEALAKIVKRLAGPKVTITKAAKPQNKYQDIVAKLLSKYTKKNVQKKVEKVQITQEEALAKIVKKLAGPKVTIKAIKPVQKIEKVKITQEQAHAKIVKRLAGPKVTITKAAKPEDKYEAVVEKLLKKYNIKK